MIQEGQSLQCRTKESWEKKKKKEEGGGIDEEKIVGKFNYLFSILRQGSLKCWSKGFDFFRPAASCQGLAVTLFRGKYQAPDKLLYENIPLRKILHNNIQLIQYED